MPLRPHILYGEQTIAAGTRVPFNVNTLFFAPRDMEIAHIWFGAMDRRDEMISREEDLWINWNVKTRPPVILRTPMPARLFDNKLLDRVSGSAQRGWLWKLEHAYRIHKDGRFQLEVRNAIPAALPVVTDAFTAGAHAFEACKDDAGAPKVGGPRLLALQDTFPRAMTSRRYFQDGPGTSQADGRYDVDCHELVFMRGGLFVPGDPAGSVSNPRRFYLRAAPVGREAWSQDDVPLPAYGPDAQPYEQVGIFWKPKEQIILPTGYGFEFDCQNVGSTDFILQIAIVGWVEEG